MLHHVYRTALPLPSSLHYLIQPIPPHPVYPILSPLCLLHTPLKQLADACLRGHCTPHCDSDSRNTGNWTSAHCSPLEAENKPSTEQHSGRSLTDSVTSTQAIQPTESGWGQPGHAETTGQFCQQPPQALSTCLLEKGGV